MKHDTIKVYAQLCPDMTGVELLSGARTSVDGWVENEELHMTLIHFGRIATMYDEITAQTGVTRARFDAALDVLINRIDDELREYIIMLPFRDFALFGKNNTTLVARFYPSDELIAKHATLYGYVEEFLHDCGIEDPHSFTRSNHALQHSHQLEPHVTLHKSYDGELSTMQIDTILFCAMPIEYSH